MHVSTLISSYNGDHNALPKSMSLTTHKPYYVYTCAKVIFPTKKTSTTISTSIGMKNGEIHHPFVLYLYYNEELL